MIDFLNFFSDKWLELIWRVTWQATHYLPISNSKPTLQNKLEQVKNSI